MPQRLRELSHVELRPRLHAADSLRDGVSDRVMRVINRFASVPAGFPEPYPNRRFTSDVEVQWGA
jgi:hypothetical protein